VVRASRGWAPPVRDSHPTCRDPVLTQVIAAPCTRTRRGIPTEVDLDQHDGLPVPCVANLDSLQLVRPGLCVERITALRPERMQEICQALHLAVGC